MNPAVRFQSPNPRFLVGLRRQGGLHFWRAAFLDEPYVGYHRNLSHDAYVRLGDGGLRLVLLVFQQIKIEPMKVEALDQVSDRLRFKAGQTRIAQLTILFPVTTGDAIQQFLR